ncbi:MAG: S9 family peptidase [Bacteroidia bacterium]
MKKIITVVILLLSSQLHAQRVMTPEILMTLKRISEPRLSPDGKKILYNVRTMDIAANNGNNDIYIVDADGKNVVAIANTKSNETAARWIAGGTKIAYLDDITGDAQIYEMNIDGSSKTQVSNNTGGITNYGYSPKGGYVWFTADVKLDKNPAEIYPDLPKAKDARIIDGLMYRHWNVWSDYTYSHLFVAKYVNGKLETPKDVMPTERFDTPTKPDDGDEQIAFNYDDTKIAYSCKKFSGTAYATSTNTDIYVFDIVTGATENVSRDMDGYDKQPAFSTDGKSMLWLSMEEPGYEADRNRLMIYDIVTKTKKELLTNFDYSVSKADYNAKGNMIYFIAGINATEQVLSYDLNPKAKTPMRQITNVVADITDYSLSSTAKEPVMIIGLMRHDLPVEIFNVDLKTGNTNQISQVNTQLLSTLSLGKTEKRMVKTTDGKEMLTWVIYPPNFDPAKKYPALLYCQGGPQSTVSQFFSYRWNFQMMAAKGYIVVAPNRRGLPSFGEKWNDDIRGDWGGQPMNDLLSAIDDVSKENYVDKNRLGCVGASFGGYSVYWLAGHHNKRFKAFIAHDGVFDLKSMFGMTEEVWFPTTDFEGPYWKQPTPKSYTKWSPMDYVQNWDTPMLIIHNEKDFRVPVAQGMEAFTAAQMLNVPCRFLYFPDEGHWVLKPQNEILWQRVFFDWLDKYLK